MREESILLHTIKNFLFFIKECMDSVPPIKQDSQEKI